MAELHHRPLEAAFCSLAQFFSLVHACELLTRQGKGRNQTIPPCSTAGPCSRRDALHFGHPCTQQDPRKEPERDQSQRVGLAYAGEHVVTAQIDILVLFSQTAHLGF